MSIFDGLQPLPDSAQCDGLIRVYFDQVAKSYPFMSRKRYYRTAEYSRNKPLVLSMIIVASCFLHTSRSNSARLVMDTYADRLLPYLMSLTPTLPTVMALFHMAASSLMRQRWTWFTASAGACVAGFRVAGGFENVHVGGSSPREGATEEDLDVWLTEEEARRTAWFVGWLDRMVGSFHSSNGTLEYDELSMVPL
ncbi:hypothetical protein HDU93_006746, partial [Gonapodya sp. JEL0774]